MLVEINLLPQKERRKKGFLISLVAMLALFLLLGSYYSWQMYTTKNEIAAVDREIKMTNKVANAEEKNAEKTESAMSVNLLKNAVEWANNYPIRTIPVMQHLTSLLPERGFIQSFGYTEAGTVTLSVQFDNAREAAYFLDSLNESKWIEDASLSSLNAEEKTDDVETTTVATSQNPTSTDNPETSDPNPTSTTVQMTDQTTVNDSNTEVTTTPPIEIDKNILPRYIGQFEITFNKETIKKLIRKSEVDGEGVTAQ